MRDSSNHRSFSNSSPNSANETPTQQQQHHHHYHQPVVMEDLFLGDLDGIFDDDGQVNPLDMADMGDDSFSSFPGSDTMNPHNATAAATTTTTAMQTSSLLSLSIPSQIGSALASLNPLPMDFDRRRRSSTQSSDSNATPPSWHSEAADKTYRQKMIHDIAGLLHARKKTQPSQEWLQQLPHKARKLEGRLYWSAACLEAYLDKKTLKNRLRRVADSISKKYMEAKKVHRGQHHHHRFSNKSTRTSSTCSHASVATTSSQGSLDSLRSLRNSMMLKANMSTTTAAAAAAVAAGNGTSNSTAAAASQSQAVAAAVSGSTTNAAAAAAAAATSSRNNSFSAAPMNNPPLNSIPEARYFESSMDSIMDSSRLPENPMLVGQQLQHLQRGSSSGSTVSALSMSSVQQGSSSSSSSNKNNNNNNNNAGDVSELERQKAINAKLQEQIQENIRRQEHLVRQLQGNQPGQTQQQQQQQIQQQTLQIQQQQIQQQQQQGLNAPVPSSISSAPGPGNNMAQGMSMEQMANAAAVNNMQMQQQQQRNAMQLIAAGAAPFNTPNLFPQQNVQQSSRVNVNGLAQHSTMGGMQVGGLAGAGGGGGHNSFAAQGNVGLQQQAALVAAARNNMAISNPQLAMLMASNPLFAAQQQALLNANAAGSTGALGAGGGVGVGFNPAMPPPSLHAFQGSAAAAAAAANLQGRRLSWKPGDEAGEGPLSPGSFNW